MTFGHKHAPDGLKELSTYIYRYIATKCKHTWLGDWQNLVSRISLHFAYHELALHVHVTICLLQLAVMVVRFYQVNIHYIHTTLIVTIRHSAWSQPLLKLSHVREGVSPAKHARMSFPPPMNARMSSLLDFHTHHSLPGLIQTQKSLMDSCHEPLRPCIMRSCAFVSSGAWGSRRHRGSGPHLARAQTAYTEPAPPVTRLSFVRLYLVCW